MSEPTTDANRERPAATPAGLAWLPAKLAALLIVALWGIWWAATRRSVLAAGVLYLLWRTHA